jgi:hypothetical protein
MCGDCLKKKVFKYDKKNPYRFMIGVLDVRNNTQIFKGKNLNLSQVEDALKDLKLKLK